MDDLSPGVRKALLITVSTASGAGGGAIIGASSAAFVTDGKAKEGAGIGAAIGGGFGIVRGLYLAFA